MLEYLRAPGVLERPEKADALEAEVIRGRLRDRGRRRASGFDFELREIDALRRSDDPARASCSARPAGCCRGRTANRARCSTPSRRSTPQRSAAMARALDELSERPASAVPARS